MWWVIYEWDKNYNLKLNKIKQYIEREKESDRITT